MSSPIWAAEQRNGIGDGGVQIKIDGLDDLFAAEGQELPRQRGGALPRFADGFGVGPEGIPGGKASEEEAAIAIDDREQIIEVVGDTTGETADGLHFLGLDELGG